MVLQVIGCRRLNRKFIKMNGLQFLKDPPLRASIEGTTHFEGNSAMPSLRALRLLAHGAFLCRAFGRLYAYGSSDFWWADGPL